MNAVQNLTVYCRIVLVVLATAFLLHCHSYHTINHIFFFLLSHRDQQLGICRNLGRLRYCFLPRPSCRKNNPLRPLQVHPRANVREQQDGYEFVDRHWWRHRLLRWYRCRIPPEPKFPHRCCWHHRWHSRHCWLRHCWHLHHNGICHLSNGSQCNFPRWKVLERLINFR